MIISWTKQNVTKYKFTLVAEKIQLLRSNNFIKHFLKSHFSLLPSQDSYALDKNFTFGIWKTIKKFFTDWTLKIWML